VIEIAMRPHVHHQRRLAVHPQGRGGDECAFDAVRGAGAQHHPHRAAGVALQLEVLAQVVEKGLNFAGRVEPAQHRELGGGQAEVLAAGEFFSRHPLKV
jgi:hypothetical protein